jgi:hypothetical protein
LIVFQRLIIMLTCKLGEYRKFRLNALLLIILFALVACAPAASGTAGSGSGGTAVAGTAQPVRITPLPPDFTPPPVPTPPAPTPIPVIPGGLGPTELKYQVLAKFPDLFYCDPDYYPVARGNELDLALQRFPELQANAEEFNAILAHNNFSGLSTFNDDQKLFIYQEHKKLAAVHFEVVASAYRFQLQVSSSKGSGELISGLIDNQGSITGLERKSSIATCPICLAAGTLIDTPTGPLPVQTLSVGALVWTLDRDGLRVAKPILQVGSTIEPASHQVVHLVLDDGREVWVSPGHPTAGGRSVGQLQPGDALDGGVVLSVERVRYTAYATYDLLPAGETGFYWANKILLGSTLNTKRQSTNPLNEHPGSARK